MPSLIQQTRTDVDFASQIVDLRLESLGGAMAVAVMQYEPTGTAEETEPLLMRWNINTAA